MKLVKYSDLKEKKKKLLSIIIGTKDNIPAVYARNIKDVGWEIIKSREQKDLFNKNKQKKSEHT